MQTEARLEHNSDDNASEAFELRSNNRHVIPFGVLIVLCTIYLTVAGLQTNYNYYFKPGVAALNLSSHPPNVDATNDVQTQALCSQIEIFTENAFKKEATKLLKEQSKQSSNNLAIRRKQSRISKSKTTKKDITKKSNTAEPIIYLFALVFIYLLLKAASDINQHYKSQKKGDKRLRRCSLQSYAQKEQRASHLDRRASKGISTKSLPKF